MSNIRDTRDERNPPPLGDEEIDVGARTRTDIPGLMTPDQVTAEHKELSRLPTVPTKFPALDHKLDGMRPTQMYVVAAGTGQGKSSLITQLGSQYDGLTIIWTREMGAWQLQGRMIAQMSGKDSNEILRGVMTEDEYAGHVAKFSDRIWYYTGGSKAIGRVVRYVTSIAKERGMDTPVLLIIDYLQKLAPSTNQLREAISEASEIIRSLTQKYRLVTWVVSAVGRDAARRIREQRDLEPGDLVDVGRESGAIEYDCAALLVLGLDPEDANGERKAVISIAKNRFGRLGQVEYLFMGETGRFKELRELEPKAKRDRRKRRDKILAAVRQADEPPNKTTIHRVSNGRKQSIFREIDAMVQDGELVKAGKGYLPGPNAPADAGKSDE